MVFGVESCFLKSSPLGHGASNEEDEAQQTGSDNRDYVSEIHISKGGHDGQGEGGHGSLCVELTLPCISILIWTQPGVIAIIHISGSSQSILYFVTAL